MTPEEMEIHNRPDVKKAQEHVFQDFISEYRKARKAKKNGSKEKSPEEEETEAAEKMFFQDNDNSTMENTEDPPSNWDPARESVDDSTKLGEQL